WLRRMQCQSRAVKAAPNLTPLSCFRRLQQHQQPFDQSMTELGHSDTGQPSGSMSRASRSPASMPSASPSLQSSRPPCQIAMDLARVVFSQGAVLAGGDSTKAATLPLGKSAPYHMDRVQVPSSRL